MNNIMAVIDMNNRIRKSIEESIREIRTNILSNDKAGTSILFASAYKREGRSTISLSLALSLSRCKKKVVWVNCDFRRKSNMFSIHKEESAEKDFGGLADYLNGKCTSDQIIYSVQEEQLHIIPRGKVQRISYDLFETEAFQELLAELKQNYDYVIVDTAAGSDYVDSRIVASKCDSVVIVIRQGRTKRVQIQCMINEMKKCNNNIIGAVINQSRKFV